MVTLLDEPGKHGIVINTYFVGTVLTGIVVSAIAVDKNHYRNDCRILILPKTVYSVFFECS